MDICYAENCEAPRSPGPPKAMTDLSGRERFSQALACRPVDRPPVWLMRQAGRCLPEYRRLRECYSFEELISTPELATEATLQPIRRFGFDAAILFSDILVVPQALGQGFHFLDKGGVKMEFALRNLADIEKLDIGAVRERLAPVGDILRMIRHQLGSTTALLGFAGSPWTLANFMLEGGSCHSPTKALALLREQPDVYYRLAWKLSHALIDLLQIQLEAGVDAIQLFDSLGGLLSKDEFEFGSGVWMRTIVDNFFGQVPFIVFSKGCRHWDALANTGAVGFGIDHETDLRTAADQLPEDAAVQGNLDPQCLVTSSPGEVESAATALLRSMAGRKGYIFNLGHGVPPNARMENLETLVHVVKNNSRGQHASAS